MIGVNVILMFFITTLKISKKVQKENHIQSRMLFGGELHWFIVNVEILKKRNYFSYDNYHNQRLL